VDSVLPTMHGVVTGNWGKVASPSKFWSVGKKLLVGKFSSTMHSGKI